ncbi:MAG: taurine dioxygenase [Actinobacteria bacterium]|nr:MAG: taurine dioxygenase [Actinomycetota bacterium]
MTVEVTPIARSLGAIVSGVDLRSRVSDEDFGVIYDALMQHLVLFFRDQDLDDEQHLAFASRFGSPNVYPTTRARGLDLPIEFIEDTPDSPPKADLWHTDAAFLAEPPDIAVLNMRLTAPVGGDTLWLNLYEAYDKLSPTMQHIVDQLSWDVHVGDWFRDATIIQYGEEIYQRVADQFHGAQHPIARVHPVTGRKALYMCGDYIKRITGMSAAETELLLRFLRSQLDDPNIQVRWHYEPYDVVVWDERCTNHRALSDHFPSRRLVRRCTVGAAVPAGVR